MPIIKSHLYRPPFFLKYHHFSTIFPSLLRKVQGLKYKRERWETPDGDFIDVDWSRRGEKKLLVALHGLEGSSDSTYIKGIIKIFNDYKWDGVAMNFRGCSGEPNRLQRGYHSGDTGDLDFVLSRIIEEHDYEEIVLVGFSLGGNVVLKYGGEKGNEIHPKIKKLIGVSVPIDLEGCSNELTKWNNKIYLNRFLDSLKEKVKLKLHLFQNIDLKKVFSAKTFEEFDGGCTAPIFGFESARDYWEKSSSKAFLDKISIPALLISARDDSFLSESCYPYEQAQRLKNLFLMTPKFGGHVGFAQFNSKGYYWTEERIIDFVLRFDVGRSFRCATLDV